MKARPQVAVTLPIGDDTIVLFETLAMRDLDADEATRNIYRVHKDGSIAWQIARRIAADAPFTGVYFVGKTLKAYSWDGGEYTIDPDTGSILGSELIR